MTEFDKLYPSIDTYCGLSCGDCPEREACRKGFFERDE